MDALEMKRIVEQIADIDAKLKPLKLSNPLAFQIVKRAPANPEAIARLS